MESVEEMPGEPSRLQTPAVRNVRALVAFVGGPVQQEVKETEQQGLAKQVMEAGARGKLMMAKVLWQTAALEIVAGLQQSSKTLWKRNVKFHTILIYLKVFIGCLLGGG